MNRLLAAALLSLCCRAFAQDPGPAAPALASLPQDGTPRLKSAFDRHESQERLQAFVDAAYAKGFRYLGDERDFDHGHLLFAQSTGPARPVAVLYHTQEFASLYNRARPGGKYDYLDRESRNWIQWLDGSGRIEDARKYARSEYPDTPSWRVFQVSELPRYRAFHTVTAKMLDPEAMGVAVARTVQWVFRRVACPEGDEELLSVRLPTGERVCLRQSY